MQTIIDIVNQIKSTVKPMFDEREVSAFKFFRELEVYCSKTIYEELKGQKYDAYTLHDRKSAKGWSKSAERYLNRTDSDLKAMIKKDTIHLQLKIDVAVAKKLSKIDVTSIELISCSLGKDGFAEGAWKINGSQIFSFETIYAGGYNIQCLHIRTLYRLK